MVVRTWYRRGPRVMGYQPGWLWWAAALMLVALVLALGVREVRQAMITEQYIAERIAHHAEAQGLEVALVASVVEAESGGDWQAKSPVGAKGLMQVMPIAHDDVRERFGVGPGDLYDVDYNLQIGTLYLRYLLDRFDGDVALAVAAYHMGPTSIARGLRKYPRLSSRDMIEKHAGPQTRAYVKRVLADYEQARVKPSAD